MGATRTMVIGYAEWVNVVDIGIGTLSGTVIAVVISICMVKAEMSGDTRYWQ